MEKMYEKSYIWKAKMTPFLKWIESQLRFRFKQFQRLTAQKIGLPWLDLDLSYAFALQTSLLSAELIEAAIIFHLESCHDKTRNAQFW